MLYAKSMPDNKVFKNQVDMRVRQKQAIEGTIF